MTYEVEQKFPLSDLADLESRIAALGGRISDPQRESDRYYAHPARDFAATDEALRIRRTDRGNYITYKGPKVDATTKTRREIELPLWERKSQLQAFEDLIEALGFVPVAEVCKRRRKAAIPWQGREVEASLDDVADVGCYVELELAAEDDDLDSARACIASLAERLGLSGSERCSYLELLLAQRSP
jgi:adenylate cyclase class 2